METSMIVGTMANLCYETKSLLAILAMVLFICSAVTYIISKLMVGKWKKGFRILSIILVGIGVVLIIFYLAVPAIISWLIGPDIMLDDPCAYDPYYDIYPRNVSNCTEDGANCTRILKA